MRCYHFSNMYLSSIQQGIQSAHAQMELFIKYKNKTPEKDILFDWAENHKTMIVLNGGYLSTMVEAVHFFNTPKNPYPFSTFYESEDALGGILTNIAIILPEKIYKTSEFIRKRLIDKDHNIIKEIDADTFNDVVIKLQEFGYFTEFEKELCVFLNNFNLAS